MSKNQFLFLTVATGIVIAVFLCGSPMFASWRQEKERALARQEEYKQKLLELGINPSDTGVESYILTTVVVGASVSEVIQKLSLIALTWINADPQGTDCQTLHTQLHFPLEVPPSLFGPTSVPLYRIDICYSNGVIINVGVLTGPFYD